jgi:hypothetical protein
MMPEFDGEAWDCLKVTEKARILEEVKAPSGLAFCSFGSIRRPTQCKIIEFVMREAIPYPHENMNQPDLFMEVTNENT